MSLLSGNNIANGNELSLQIDNNGPFYPGDSVKGQISTHLPYMCVRGELTVRLFGVLDSQIGGNLNMDVKEFHTQEIRLWLNPNGDNSNENLTNQQGYPMCGSLPAGQQHYPFSFTLPDGIYALPSSFDAPQNQLRYTVRVELRGSFESNSAESVISQLCSQLLSSHITRRVERLICVRNYVDADQPGLCRPISQVGHLSRASWFGKLTRAAASVATNRRSKKSSAMELLMPVLNPIITRNVTSTEHTPRLRLSMSRTGYCPGEWVHMTINMDHGNDLDTALASPPPPSLISSSASSVSSSSSVSDAESIEEQSSGIELPEIHRRSSASFVNLVSEQLLQQQQSEQRPQSRGRRVTLSGMSVPHDHLLQVPFTLESETARISLASSGMTRTYIPTPHDKLSVDILLRREIITRHANNVRETERTAVAVGTHEFSEASGGSIELRLPDTVVPTTDDPTVGISVQYHLKITARFTTRKPSSYSAGRLLGSNTQTRVCVLRVPLTVGTCRSSQDIDAVPPLYQDACGMPPAYESLLTFTNVTGEPRPTNTATSTTSTDDDGNDGNSIAPTSMPLPAITVDHPSSRASSQTNFQLDLPRFSVSSFTDTIAQMSNISTSLADSAFAVAPSESAVDLPLSSSSSSVTTGWWTQYTSGSYSVPASPTHTLSSKASTAYSAASIAAALARHERAYMSAPDSPLVAEFSLYKSAYGASALDFPLPSLEVDGLPQAEASPATINGWV